MDDIGLLVKDMGVRPQGKAAPMSASQSASSLRSGVWGPADYADVFGGPSRTRAASPPSDFDSFFRPSAAKPPASSMPVYDRPVYDDDIFDGVPGVRSAAPANRASSPPIDDLLESVGRARKTESTKAPTPANRASSPPIDDLLESFGRARKTESTKATPPANRASSPPIDDLLESFGRARNTESTKAPAPPPANRASSPPIDDLLEGLRRARKAESTKAPAPPPANRASSPPIDDLLESLRRARKAESTKAPPRPPANRASSPPIDYLLESFGLPKKTESAKVAGERGSQEKSKGLGGFEELIPGFVGSSSPPQREPSETNHKQSAKSTANASDDPFVVLETSSTAAYSSSGLFTDPLEQISRPTNSENTRANASSVDEGVFDDANDFDRLRKSVPSSTTSEKDGKQRETGLPRNVQNASIGHSAGRESLQKSSVDPFENLKPQGLTTDDHLESNDILYEKPSKTSNSSTSFTKHGFQNSDVNVKMSERDATSDMFPRSVEADDVWLTIDEIPLVTQPTTCLPPSRPPPPIVDKQALTGKADHGASVGSDAKKYYNQSFWQSNQNHHVSEQVSDTMKKSGTSPIDELENFAVGKPQKYANEYAEEMETNSFAAASAAAMKEAMDRAEAKFRQAREVRERERGTKSAKLRDFEQQEGDAEEMLDGQDQVDQEMQERLEHERRQRERVEKEREEKRRERAREQELERERERAKEAVGRATREARDRAAAEARRKAERAAVDKVNADSRLRAERAVVQKIAAEARERAAAEARERAERAAAEAREKVVAEARAAARAQERAATEAREKAATEAREKAAAERAAADARSRAERAAAEAREKAAAAAREKQYKNENDLESFFGMDARASSAPRQRATSSETVFDAANRAGSDGMQKTSVGSSSTFRKASSANIVDDLTSIFGASPSSNEFQEVEGESEERRRARLERHQRTLERAAKALAEKNERDIQVQREQAERHRIAETLDIEIKRWAAGKEGNLRALLSTLQYVLWPECGWQPVSLTDLITAASVKKVYRKATLCIHPDKVQQKGANLQQKYTAEKVFDLLKEAWNKFNSEELF